MLDLLLFILAVVGVSVIWSLFTDDLRAGSAVARVHYHPDDLYG